MTPHARFFTRALVLALLLWAAPAMAGDVDGKWAGTVSTPGGGREVAHHIKNQGPPPQRRRGLASMKSASRRRRSS